MTMNLPRRVAFACSALTVCLLYLSKHDSIIACIYFVFLVLSDPQDACVLRTELNYCAYLYIRCRLLDEARVFDRNGRIHTILPELLS